MHKIFRVLMLMLATALVACGGGGGSPGGNPNQPDLFTTAPSSVSIDVGSFQEYTISGGIPPYKAVNENDNFAIGTITGNSLNIGGKFEGKTTVSVLDNTGKKVSITVDVNSDFSTSAPRSITINIGANSAQTFRLSGGRAPYAAVSSDTSVAAVSIISSKITITGLSEGKAEITVRDTSGTVRPISVTVNKPAPLFTTADGAIDISVGAAGSRTFTIGGGIAPYTASSSNNGFVSVAVNENSLFVTGNAVGSATVTVRDSAGATIPVAVKVSSVVPLFTTADGPISLFPGAGGVRNFTIGGGTAPYSASSSNSAIASVAVNGNNLVITGLVANGTAVIVTVRDNVGGLITIPVTVANVVPLYVNAPSTITLGIGAALAPTYEIGGGSAPYTAVSDNTAVATVSVNQTSLVIQGIYPGNAVVQVRDAQGAIVSLKVIVATAQGLPLYTTAPSSLNIGVGATAARTFSIGGGEKPYSVVGNNNNVAIVEQLGSDQWKVTGITIGATSVIIRDAAGNKVNVDIKVAAPDLRVSPTDFSIFVGMDAVVKISGGQPPYYVSSGIPAAVKAVVTGDELRITGLLLSDIKGITIYDATGQLSQAISVKVIQGTGTIRLSPNAISVSEIDNQPLNFSIFSAAQGEVCLFTSNPTLLKPINPDGTTNPCFTITSSDSIKSFIVNTGTQGNRCVPSDTDVTISLVDSSRSVASATITILDNGLGAGNCIPVVPQDIVDMTQAAAGLSTTVLSGSSRRYTITNGVAPYVVDPQTSDTGIATGTVLGNVLTITGISTGGPTTVTVRDAAGTRFPVRVKVTPP